MWTALAFVAVVLVVALAWSLPRLTTSYARWVGEHYRARSEPVMHGRCARLGCSRETQGDSAYCSSRHEMDDEYNAAGY